MNTKTLALLAVAGGLAYMGYRTKQAAEAAVANLPLPPPNGGPVVNGLSFYQLEGLSGFGSSFKKAVKKGAKAVSKISPSAAIVKKVTNTSDPGDLLKKVDPVKNLHKSPVFSKTMLVRKIGPKGSPKNRERPAPNQPVVYQDARGNTITESQYNAIVSAVESGQPVPTAGGWALPQGYISEKNPAAVQVPVNTDKHPSRSSPPIVPPGHHYGWSNKNEELTITNTYEDPYSNTPGTAHTAASSGAPGLPGGITTDLTTPAATEAAPMAAPESSTGKVLVGTGIAAMAAYLAFA